MNDYPYNMPQYGGTDFAVGARISNVLKGVYLRMTFGLLVTALVSLLAVNLGFLQVMIQTPIIYWGLFIAEIIIVIALGGQI